MQDGNHVWKHPEHVM